MHKNLTKEKIRAGQTVYGVFCEIYSPVTVELLGLTGFDFVVIDAEHTPLDVETCGHMVRAADNVRVTPIIRVAVNVHQNILRYLDIGALGVQLPMINTKLDAETVVQAAKYPPEGKRGLGGVRANDYGVTVAMGEYIQQANRETLVVTQLESKEAIHNIDEILAVEGIDVFFIGPMDLSCSMGYPGQMSHPEVQATIEHLVKKIREAGKVAGTWVGVEDLKRAKELGFQYITHSVHVLLVKAAQKYLEQARTA